MRARVVLEAPVAVGGRPGARVDGELGAVAGEDEVVGPLVEEDVDAVLARLGDEGEGLGGALAEGPDLSWAYPLLLGVALGIDMSALALWRLCVSRQR